MYRTLLPSCLSDAQVKSVGRSIESQFSCYGLEHGVGVC